MTDTHAEPAQDSAQDDPVLALHRLAHELQTPLGIARMAVSMQLDLLRHSSAVDEAQGNARAPTIEALRESAHLLQDSVERCIDILSTHKHQAMSKRLDSDRFSLATCLRAAMAYSLAAHRSVVVAHSVEAPDDLTMVGDQGAWHQLIGNLVNNSVLHGFAGRSQGRITICASAGANGTVKVSYSDDGVGMTDDVRQRLFEDGFSTRLTQGGQGLGMGIIRELVQVRLGGQLTVENPLRGAGFRIVAPTQAPNSI
jgi:signal transduction histidine kinase